MYFNTKTNVGFLFGFFIFNYTCATFAPRPEVGQRRTRVDVYNDKRREEGFDWKKDKIIEKIETMVQPTKNPSSVVGFQLSCLNQVYYFGDVPLSEEDKNDVLPPFRAAGNDERVFFYLSSQGKKKYEKYPIISTGEGTWVNKEAFGKLSKEERQLLVRQHAVVPYKKKIYRNLATSSAEYAVLTGALWGAYHLTDRAMAKYPRSKIAFAVSGLVVTGYRTGLFKNILREYVSQRSDVGKDGALVFSEEELNKIERDANNLLVNEYGDHENIGKD